MLEATKGLLLILSAIFPIVDPIGGSPFFLSLTSDYGSEARKALSWRIAADSFVLLVGSYFVGTYQFVSSYRPSLRLASMLQSSPPKIPIKESVIPRYVWPESFMCGTSARGNIASGVFYASREGKLSGDMVDQSTFFAALTNRSFQDNANEAIHRFIN